MARRLLNRGGGFKFSILINHFYSGFYCALIGSLLCKVVVRTSDLKPKLTLKQRQFIDSYIKYGNATKAALEAGYSPKTAARQGSENLHKDYIAAAIEARIKQMEDHKIADAAEVMHLLTRIMRGEEYEDITISTPAGAETVRQGPSNRDKLAAARELLKRYPTSTPVDAAQLRKLNAQVRTLEAKAAVAEKLSAEDNQQLDAILDKIVKVSQG